MIKLPFADFISQVNSFMDRVSTLTGERYYCRYCYPYSVFDICLCELPASSIDIIFARFQRKLRINLFCNILQNTHFAFDPQILLSTRLLLLWTCKFYFWPANFTFILQILISTRKFSLLTSKFYFWPAVIFDQQMKFAGYICDYRPIFGGERMPFWSGVE